MLSWPNLLLIKRLCRSSASSLQDTQFEMKRKSPACLAPRLLVFVIKLAFFFSKTRSCLAPLLLVYVVDLAFVSRKLVRVWRLGCSCMWSTWRFSRDISFVSDAYAARLRGRHGVFFAKSRSCLAPLLLVYVVDFAFLLRNLVRVWRLCCSFTWSTLRFFR